MIAATGIVDGMQLPMPLDTHDAERIERLQVLKARVELAKEFLRLAVTELRKELGHD